MPSMTLPANDAFTLGLTGSHDPSRPAYSLSFRSTSPKIPFVSSSKSSYSSGHSPRSPRQTRRSMSNGVPNGAPNGNGNHYSSESNTRRRTRTEQTSHTVAIKSDTKSLLNKQKDQAVDWEIPRKTLHSSIGFLTLYLYTSHGSPKPVIVSLSLALAVIVPADILRLNFPWFERIYERCLGFLMRESEKKSTNGVIWYIIGVVFVLAFYPLDVAVVSILILSWADTAASTFGRMFGRYTSPLPRRVPILGIPFAPRKSLAGFIAGSLAGAAVAAGFWGWIAPLGNIQPLWSLEPGSAIHVVEAAGEKVVTSGWGGLGLISVVSGIVSGVAEALDLGSVDDNLSLPIISGGCIWGFLRFLSFISG